MPSQQEIGFNQAMLDLYKRALKETKYPANDFLGLVLDLGGLPAAKQLLLIPPNNPEYVPTGFTEIVLRNRIDLTMEAVILDSTEWLSLFDENELLTAYKRLKAVGYEPKWKPPA